MKRIHTYWFTSDFTPIRFTYQRVLICFQYLCLTFVFLSGYISDVHVWFCVKRCLVITVFVGSFDIEPLLCFVSKGDLSLRGIFIVLCVIFFGCRHIGSFVDASHRLKSSCFFFLKIFFYYYFPLRPFPLFRFFHAPRLPLSSLFISSDDSSVFFLLFILHNFLFIFFIYLYSASK